MNQFEMTTKGSTNDATWNHRKLGVPATPLLKAAGPRRVDAKKPVEGLDRNKMIENATRHTLGVTYPTSRCL